MNVIKAILSISGCENNYHDLFLGNKRAMMALNRSPESVCPQNEFYLYYYYCSNLWPQGYHMNRIDIGPNIIVQGQMIKALLLLVSEKRNFKVFFFVPMFQTCDPRGGAQFDPRGIIWTTLVEVHYEILHTKYRSSALSSFREEEFQSFPSLFLCFELVTPGVGPVLTPGISYEQSW